jgi:hypothetical protein
MAGVAPVLNAVALRLATGQTEPLARMPRLIVRADATNV